MVPLLNERIDQEKEKTEDEENMIRMISSSYDISDKKYIEPVLECLNGK